MTLINREVTSEAWVKRNTNIIIITIMVINIITVTVMITSTLILPKATRRERVEFARSCRTI